MHFGSFFRLAMRFRTEIEDIRLKTKIDYTTKIFAVGSCFAQNMTEKMISAKLSASFSPVGILFNPLSIAQALKSFALRTPADSSRVTMRGEEWVSLDCHSALARASESEALDAINYAILEGHRLLHDAQVVIITFGTAWAYEHIATKKVVANCHKLPQKEFLRRKLSIKEICDSFKPLFEGILKDKQVIFTLSPVRHVADSLAENSLSKSLLRVAIAELCALYPQAEYFPAFEIVTDDLRDYRFYTEDMVHPTAQAIEYIWEKFSAATFSAKALDIASRIEKIRAAAAHRPFNPSSQEYAVFCQKYLAEIERLPEVDFSGEKAIFEKFANKFVQQ